MRGINTVSSLRPDLSNQTEPLKNKELVCFKLKSHQKQFVTAVSAQIYYNIKLFERNICIQSLYKLSWYNNFVKMIKHKTTKTTQPEIVLFNIS